MPLLQVENVTKCFGALQAVRDVSFGLQNGEMLGLIGPNGAGKTTIFNMIAGNYSPDNGKILFKGKRIDGKKPYEICHLGISRTYQLVKPFLSQTVFENALLGASFGGIHRSDSTKAAEAAISLVGLESLREKFVNSLDFLHRRKAELARAFATGAKLILLDEPMAGLNPVEVAEFLDIIKKINSTGTTILLIEHVMHAIMQLSSRIIVLDHGEKIAEGSPPEIAQDAKVIQVYLGEQQG